LTKQPPANSFHHESRAGWRQWLQDNYARDDGVWFIRYKRAAGRPYVDVEATIEEAFDRYPTSRDNFEAFPRSTKRSILEWILNAKLTGTRQKRVEEIARLAGENIRANQ